MKEFWRPNIFAEGENKIYVFLLDIFPYSTFSEILVTVWENALHVMFDEMPELLVRSTSSQAARDARQSSQDFWIF